MISIFINEKSFHGQFNRISFDLYFTSFIDLLDCFQKVITPHKLIMSTSFHLVEGIAGENIRTSIRGNRDLNLRYVSIFQRLNINYWNNSPKHKADVNYVYQQNDYVNTTVAEITESKYEKQELLVAINILESCFENLTKIPIVRKDKGNSTVVEIESSNCIESFKAWMKIYDIQFPDQRIFEHNQKHHNNVSDQGVVSKLECSEEQAQKLLDTAIAEESFVIRKLYNYDSQAKKVVIFRMHEPDKYHGYHESDVSKIPDKVQKKLKLKE